MAEALPREAVVGVIGAGAMGAGIAQVAAQAGHRVLLTDSQPGAVERALNRMAKDLRALVAKGKIAAADAEATIGRMQGATLEEFGGCRLVIEAIVEDLDAKRNLFSRLDSIIDDRCIVATNTSSLSVTAMAAGLAHPARIVGMHFFNPPTRMKLVEVVSGLETGPEIAEAVFRTAEAWGKKAAYAKST
jgi:3-hydroxybutyryl-CoA dehydrogenase